MAPPDVTGRNTTGSFVGRIRLLRDSLQFSGILWHALGCFGMFWDIFYYFPPLHGTGLLALFHSLIPFEVPRNSFDFLKNSWRRGRIL